jgi:hypothetical protein
VASFEHTVEIPRPPADVFPWLLEEDKVPQWTGHLNRYERLDYGALGAGSRGTSASRERNSARNALIVVQVAFALVLLVGAGLMIRTFQALNAVDPGFTNPTEIQVARIWIPQAVTPEAERYTRTQREILDTIAALPGVTMAGFGAGAVLTAPIAKQLVLSIGVFPTFSILGVIYFVMVVGAAYFMKNPPEGWKPEGWEPDTTERSDRSGVDFELGGALRTWQWYVLWAMLFLNVSAGIAIIAEADPIAQEIGGLSAAAASILVILISIGNGAGRFLWAWLSDAIGRKWVFFTMFVLQAVLFFLLPLVSVYFLLAVLAFVIVSCYGGGFGTMPAFNADYFGPTNVGTNYGLMLTAWSVGGVLGPILISRVIDTTGSYTLAFYIIAAIMIGSAVVAFIVRPPRAPPEAGARGEEGAEGARA